MNASRLLEFIRSHRLAVQVPLSHNAPQAAVVGFAICDTFEIVFDASQTTRKAMNLRQNRRIALVIGGLASGDERTVQVEGLADEPVGRDLERVRTMFYSVFPDGLARANRPDLIYIRVRLTWMRYSDYAQDPPEIVEFLLKT